MVQLGIQLHSNNKARFTKTAVLKSVMFLIPTFAACLESRYFNTYIMITHLCCKVLESQVKSDSITHV